jgi:hypothetical protein
MPIKTLLIAIKNKLHTLQEIQAKTSSATIGILSFIELQNALPCSRETIMSQNPVHILIPYIFKVLFNITIQLCHESNKTTSLSACAVRNLLFTFSCKNFIWINVLGQLST